MIMKRPAYLPLLIRHFQDRKLPPGVHHIEVRHDDDCAFWRGLPCDCEPIIETGARVDRKYGGGQP